MAKAVALLSGGLDSQLAVKLMLEQGIEVECLTSASVFHHCTADRAGEHPAVKAAARLGVPITVINTDDEMLALVKSPRFGRGKNMNPCVDCRIFLLREAANRMRATGANFIVTGEVLGQRPMSQQRHVMRQIDREAGVENLVLRPLCAQLLEETQPEREGVVDRSKLLAIRGRSRKAQMALAKRLGITDYPSPAGGCLLTDPGFSARLRELMNHTNPTLNDIELLRVGRHFRIDSRTKAIIGREEVENRRLEQLARAGDVLLDAADVPGPTTLLRGDASDANTATAARLTLRYGKARSSPSAPVIVHRPDTGERSEVIATPAMDVEAQKLLIENSVPRIIMGSNMANALLERLMDLKRKRNAVILGHNYQRPEVQDASDFTGDSLGLSWQAAKTDADVILFCGVYFMAETAAIVCPEKTVLVPDPNAGCPMANMITPRELERAKAEHPDAVVVCYVNSSAEIKAMSDICCTSANAVAVVRSIPADRDILFVPDQSLGSWVSKQLRRNLILWPGYCPTHHRILPEHCDAARRLHPNAKLVVHPECLDEVVARADVVTSTSGMLRYCHESDATEFLVGTETGMLYPLRKQNPEKQFFAVTQLADCPNMKLNTIEKMVWALEDMQYRVEVSESIAERARQAIARMLAIH